MDSMKKYRVHTIFHSIVHSCAMTDMAISHSTPDATERKGNVKCDDFQIYFVTILFIFYLVEQIKSK